MSVNHVRLTPPSAATAPEANTTLSVAPRWQIWQPAGCSKNNLTGEKLPGALHGQVRMVNYRQKKITIGQINPQP